eukprot:411465-Pleurochrysis_carterae.AAC.1
MGEPRAVEEARGARAATSQADGGPRRTSQPVSAQNTNNTSRDLVQDAPGTRALLASNYISGALFRRGYRRLDAQQTPKT